MTKLAQLLVILSALACPVAARADDTAVTREKYFSLVLPAEFSMQKASPVEDFEIYTVTDGTTPYVIVYVGNAPDYPKIKGNNNEVSLSFGTPTVRLTSKWRNNELTALEVLAVRLISPDWPRYVHAWTTTEAGDKRVAQKILLSLMVAE